MSPLLNLSTAAVLAHACAPQIAPSTVLALAQTESGLDPWVIGVNGRSHRSLHPSSAAEGVQAARALAERGVDFDVGLAQINQRNLARLHMPLAAAFDPCRNLAVGAEILTRSYIAARHAGYAEQPT